MSTKIVKAIVRGFKSHVNSEFNYSPGLTVVTGPTDSGKSAGVMQPIKWVAFGEPSGEAFLFTIRDENTKEIARQAEAAEVELHTDDGLVILKTRRKGKTAYYINGKLVSEKADVPEEVKEALGLSKQNYGDFETSLNFAYQLEAPFILSETASVGAKVLGKLAGTEIVDKAIAAISKRTYKARDEKNTAQKIIDQVNVELIEFLQVDDLLAKVQACEALLEQLEQDSVRIDVISQLVAGYGVLTDKVDETSQKLERLAVVKDLGTFLTLIDQGQAQYEVIDQFYSRLKQLRTSIETVEGRISTLKDVSTAVVLLNQSESDYSLYTLLYGYVDNLTYYIEQIKAVEAKLEAYSGITEAASLIEITDQEYDSLVSINGLYNNWTTLSSRITDQEAVLAKCKDVGTISELLISLEVDEAAAKLLYTHVASIQAIDSRKTQLERRIKTFEVLPACNGILNEAIEDFDKLTELRQLVGDYSTKQQAVEAGEKKVAEMVQAFEEAENELKAVWEEVGGVCPLCNQTVDSSHFHI